MDWQAMVLLGAYHGINPGMGWLFAVALGLQQGSALGVWRALPPIAAGHALCLFRFRVEAPHPGQTKKDRQVWQSPP